jgi:hypothetical protein
MKHKSQHSVPAAYLAAWCDPSTPAGQTPYVWIASKDGNRIDKKAPKSIFTGSDFYTVLDEAGNRDLELEHYLHRIEDAFLKARTALESRVPLNDDLMLCLTVFISTLYARTEFQKRDQSEIWVELRQVYERFGFDRTMPDAYRQVDELVRQPCHTFCMYSRS